MAVATKQTPPKYSELAIRAQIEGRTILKLEINLAGRLTLVSVEKSSGSPLLDAAALEAVAAWEFKPGLDQYGKPIDSALLVPIRFELTRPRNIPGH